MKKIYILLTAVLLGFSSCGTDEKEIINEVNNSQTDDGKDNNDDKSTTKFSEVAEMFNSNIAAISYMADETKAVSAISEKEENIYKVILSNEQDFTVYTASYTGLITPKLEIDEISGCWILEDEKTSYKAKAEIGVEIVIPKFRLTQKNDNYYWEISYDNGQSYETVWDKNSQKVPIRRNNDTQTQANPIQSFSNERSICSLTLYSGNYYMRPIVTGLICKITNKPQNGSIMAIDVNTGNDIEYTIQGESVELQLPERWKKINENVVTIDKNQPTNASFKIRSRQNDKDKTIALKVTCGEVSVYDWIKVYAKGEVINNYSKYQKGESIIIGELSINKSEFGNGIYVDQDREITDRGVYFIEPGVKVKFTGTGRYDQVIFINTSNYADEKCSVRVEKQIILDKGKHRFYCKNIKFSGINNALKSYNGYFTMAFDLCDISFDGSLFSYQREGRGFDHLSISNSIVHFAWPKTLISNEGNDKVWYAKLAFKNNLFYCPKNIGKFNILSANRGVLKQVVMENNLFVNIEPDENLISVNEHEADNNYKPWFTIKNNLFWNNDGSANGQRNIFSINNKSNVNPLEGSCENNLYWSAGNRTWKVFKQEGNINISNFAEIEKCNENPLETVDFANATFKLKEKFSQYGPQ